MECSVLQVEIVGFAGELDGASTGAVRATFDEAIGKANHVVVDLTHVPFIDSAGLGALIGGIRRVRESGGTIAIATAATGIIRLLTTTGVAQLATVCDTVDEAANLLAGEGALTPA